VLSRFEWQCLTRLWELGEAPARAVQKSLDHGPSYSTVRTILERLRAKGAVVRVRREGNAWIYRPSVNRPGMIGREIARFVDLLFGGSAASLVAQLAEMDAISIRDLRAAESQLRRKPARRPAGERAPLPPRRRRRREA
jgi:predicted transcriptional regulator